MKKSTMTRLLHAIVLIGGVLLAVLFFWGVPMYGKYMATTEAPEFAYAYWPCLIWAWAFAAPVFIALIPAWRIFSSISAPDGPFTRANAKCFQWISYLAFADAVIFPAGMLTVGFMGAGSPGLVVLVTPAVIFACLAVGLAAFCLGRLVDEAAGLKEDNDLTI